MPYFDTSVVIPYYCPEALSDKAEKILRSSERPLISSLVEVEFASCVSRKVRQKEMKARAASEVVRLFQSQVRAGIFESADLTREHHLVAAGWLSPFTVSLRTLDSLHLAVAFVRNTEIVTADRQMASAARHLGVQCVLMS